MDYMKIVGVVISVIMITIFFNFVFALPVMWLWNWLMPVIFGLGEITFFQALGLMILCSLLFKTTGYTKSE